MSSDAIGLGKEVSKLRVLLFGSTGMVGTAVLEECLVDSRVEDILVVVRRSLRRSHPKLKELVLPDVGAVHHYAHMVEGYNACFFPLGVSSIGMSEEAYATVTYDLSLQIARFFLTLEPDMAFTYVSGMGTDSTEKGRRMWARVKGKTKNALLAMPFRAKAMIRLGALVPPAGYKPKTPLNRIAYGILGPLLPVMAKFFSGMVLRSQQLGQAMIGVGLGLADKEILEMRDIRDLGRKTALAAMA